MPKTLVVNLRTGQERLYTLEPRQAVIAAYRSPNLNWWQPGFWNAPVEEGERFYFCGDWAARK